MVIVSVMGGVSLLLLVFLWSIKRGQKTVRAFVFLSAVADGKSVESANELAKRIDLHAASGLQKQAMVMVEMAFGGSQLKLISHARLEGFNQ